MSDSVWPHRWQPTRLPVPGILQARTLEWVAITFSNAWKWKEKVKSLSRVRLLATPWTAAHQAPLSLGFSRQEHWSGCRCLLANTTVIKSDSFCLTTDYLLCPISRNINFQRKFENVLCVVTVYLYSKDNKND